MFKWKKKYDKFKKIKINLELGKWVRKYWNLVLEFIVKNIFRERELVVYLSILEVFLMILVDVLLCCILVV